MAFYPTGSPAPATPSSQITVTQVSSAEALVTKLSNGQEVGSFTITQPTGTNSIAILDNGTHIRETKTVGTSGTLPTLTITKTYVPDGGSEDIISSTLYNYHNFDWGQELISVTDGLNRTTTYHYNEDTASAGYQQLKSVDLPDGKWIYYQYDGLTADSTLGITPASICYTPWKDSTKPTSDPTSFSGYVAVAQYGNGSFTRTDGKLTAWSGFSQYTDTVDSLTLNGETQTTWYGTDTSASVSTTTYSYRTDDSVAPYLQGKTYRVQDATGHQTQYSYSQGDYDPSSQIFTPLDGGSSLLTTAIEGNTASPNGIVNKTTKTETVTDTRGNAVLVKTSVLTDTAPTYDLMTTVASSYDALGNLTETRRKLGGSSNDVVTYSASYYGNLLLSSTDEFGAVTTPINAGRTQGQSVYDGAVTRVQSTTTDVAGRVISQLGTDGLTTTTVYDTTATGGAIVMVAHPSGGTSVTTYYRDGQIASVGGTAEIATNYDYSAPADGVLSTQQTQVSGANSRTTIINRDMMGRTAQVTQPVFGSGTINTISAYDATTGLLKSVTLGDGTLQPPTAYSYDELGRPQLQGLDVDGGGLSVSSTADRITETDNYYQNQSGYWFTVVETKISGTSGMVTTSKQLTRLDGLQTIAIGPDGSSTTQTLTVDRANQRVSVAQTTSAIPGPATSTYAGNTTLLDTQEARFNGTDTKTTYQYDDNGRLWKITDPLTHVTEITYVPSGTPGAGQEALRTFADTSTRISGYNLLGLLTSSSGSAVYPTSYGFNDFGEMVSLTTQRSPGVTSTTIWQRDPGTGLVSFKQYPDGKGTTYSYDAAQRLTKRVWARTLPGQSTPVETDYTFPYPGDLTTITYNDGTPGVTFSNYQPNGRPSQITDAAGTRAVTYSDFGDVADENYTGSGLLNGVDVNRTYTGAVRQTLSASLSGTALLATANYNYNATTHRLDSIGQGSVSAAYGYIPNSSLLASVTSQSGASLVRSIGYDAAGKLTSLVNSVGSATISANGTLSNPILYDSVGHRLNIPREDGSKWVYGYNTRGEVTSGGKQQSSGTVLRGYQFGYQFDDIGNRSQTTVNGRNSAYVPNALNQYTQREVPGAVDILGSADSSATITVNDTPTQRQGGLFYKQLGADNANAPALISATTVGVRQGLGPNGADIVSQTQGKLYLPKTPEVYAYDDDGNLSQDGRWSYTWDAENRLIAMESISSVPEAAKMKLTFAYSAEGRRIEKSVYHWVNGSYALASDTRFIYDGWNLIAEMDATNSVTRSYLWGQDLSGSLQGAGGVGGLLAVTTTGTNGGTYLVNYDANGNVLGLVDNQGAVAATYEYGAYGELLRVSGAMAGQNPFRFSTHYADDETGLVYAKRRYYQPTTGSWLSRDPIGISGGVNEYGYVHSNPVNLVDPFGLAGIWKLTVLGTYTNHSPNVSVTYTLDENEKCSCKKFHIDRFWNKGNGWEDDNTSPQDRSNGVTMTPTPGYTNVDPTASAIDDAPNSAAFGGLVRYSWTWHFKWKAICDGGAASGKVLSEKTADYTTSSSVGSGNSTGAFK